MILLELLFCQRQVLCRIQGGAVAAQDHHRTVFFLGQAKFFIDLDDDRSFRALVVGDAFGDQLIDDLFAQLIRFTFVEPDIHFYIKDAQDLPELLQAPFPC